MAGGGIYLVMGATGLQGGTAARALLAKGFHVRALARDPGSAAAAHLRDLGAEVVKGDLNDPATLEIAMRGVFGLFSVLVPDASGGDAERRQGLALIEAASKAGVRQIVHSGVCQAGQHESFPRWGTGYWSEAYWLDKWAVEEAIRAADFDHWTLLRPTFLMENFTAQRARFLFPHLRHGEIRTPILPEVSQQLIAGKDIGAFAAGAFARPERFDRRTIDLAGDRLTLDKTAAVLSGVLGKPITATSVSPEGALASGLPDRWVRALEWVNEVGYRADVVTLSDYGIPLTRFADWAQANAGEIIVE